MLKTTAEYKDLFENIGVLTSQQINDDITLLKRRLDNLVVNNQLSLQAYVAYYKQLDDIKKANEDKETAEKYLAVGQALSSLGQDFESVNSGIAGYISSLGAMASSYGNVLKQVSNLNKDIANGADTFSDYTSLAETGISSIVSLISSLTSAAAARKKADEDYYNSVIEFQDQYNNSLLQQQLIQSQTDGDFLSPQYQKQLGDAADVLRQSNAQLQQSYNNLSAGQAIVDKKNVVNGSAVLGDAGKGAAAGAAVGAIVGVGVLSVPAAAVGAIVGGLVGGIAGLFGGKKSVNVLTPLLQQYPELIDANGKFNEGLAKSLISTNQVTDATKALLQNSIDLYDTQQAAVKQIESTLSTLSDNIYSNLQDALVTAFENGTDAAQAFGKTVGDVIQNLVSQDIFESVFGDQFTQLSATLKATVEGGGTQEDITQDFVKFFQTAGPLVTSFQGDLEAAKEAAAAQGIDIFDPTDPASTTTATPTGIAGAISGITADQADLLDGSINGLRLTNQQTNEILTVVSTTVVSQLAEMKGQTVLQMQIAANTKRMADTSDKYLPYLGDIASNTSQNNLTNALRAAGK